MASQPADPLPLLPLAHMERAMELVSIPAAHLVRSGDGWRVAASNLAFQQAGLADAGALPPTLVAELEPFGRGEGLRREFDWTLGDSINARFFRVTAARTRADAADRCTLSFVDHTAQERTERSLRLEMSSDSLTGLPNRDGFGDLVEAAGARGARHAVLVVDLQRFGQVNNCLGGMAGDELLISVARRIKGTLRAQDGLARIGGDEFGVLLELDEASEAEVAAARIERALSTPFRLSDYQIRVECSVGIACADAAAEGVGVGGEELIRHAQFAVKRAKETGRIETYQPRAFTAARLRFAMETALRRAVENGDLVHEYQPICDLGTGRIVAFEALARWRDGEGRAVPPADFIPVAEESGLIVPLGRWGLADATRTLAAWDARAGGDCGVQMSVNLSPIQLGRDRVVDAVEGALAAAGLPGRRLKLELTESALVADPDGVATTMRALKGLGATLLMDDFGTGYSNLASLQKLPIDILKIDRSFVSGMLADRDKVAIVRAILGLAQALGMRTVAEGVEAPELGRTLSALGCAMGQGYWYAPPLPADQAYALIASATA